MEDYGRRLVVDMSFDLTVDETVRALGQEGIDVIGRFDVCDYLNRTLHHDFRRYLLLQTATPQSMLDALQQDLGAGAILSRAVAVFELADGETAVVAAEPFAATLSDPGWRSTNIELANLGDQECDRLARALQRLQRAALLYAPAPEVAVEQFT